MKTDDIMNLPEFKALIAARRRLRLPVVLTIIIGYFGFIALVAFKPSILGQPVGDGVISVGIYVGLSLLILGFILAVLYLKVADRTIAPLQQRVRDIVSKHQGTS